MWLVPEIEAPQPYRDTLSRALVARPELSELATLLAMADTDEIVRLRLLRALRDLGVQRRNEGAMEHGLQT